MASLFLIVLLVAGILIGLSLLAGLAFYLWILLMHKEQSDRFREYSNRKDNA